MIKTYTSNGDAWNMVTAAGSGPLNTWDPTKINWSDYTITPVEITWTGQDFWNVPGSAAPNPIVPSGVPYDPYNNTQQVLDGSMTWSATSYSTFTKPIGVRPDVLMGFFSPHMHALLFVTEYSTFTMAFMERVGLIWIQHELNKWTAYDRKEFYEFIDNPEIETFTGKALSKRDIQKRMSEAKDE